jgi:hypothetical protein
MRLLSTIVLGLSFAGLALAQGGPPDKVGRIPPPGKKITDDERKEFRDGADELGKDIAQLTEALKGKPALLELIPDVEIFYNAVHYALTYDEFYSNIANARKLLKLGMERAKDLKDGKAPWNTASGLIARGYRSRIDGSVQPYLLSVPAAFKTDADKKRRLDIWFHGRGENLSEMNFLSGGNAPFNPPDTFVLQPYGRYCNANHFAGEVDTFEAMENIQKHYKIDDNRITVRGFSMGGAACWHFAVHHAWRWAAAAPGAGFSETPDFLRVFANEKLKPTWYQKKLWHLYDCNDWAINLTHCPTIAYSGSKDKQKQAADVMEAAMDKVGLKLVHIIGKDMGHGYTKEAMTDISKRIDEIVEKGRDSMPKEITFTTYSLRYPRMHWITVEGMEEHWEPAVVKAQMNGIIGPNSINLSSVQNVRAFTLRMEPGRCPFSERPKIRIWMPVRGQEGIGQEIEGPPRAADGSWTAHFRMNRGNDKWEMVPNLESDTLRKKPGLQGPIDDAFMDRFLMVRPTGKAINDKAEKWTTAEMAHATDHWRRQFRGIAPVKDDTKVTDDDIASSNLILWGDPRSNSILAKIADKLPIKWDEKSVTVGDKTYDAGQHVPVLIYPNPLNPEKYVVINSGFTFREYDYLNNARQVPRLPDWAILDISQPPTSQWPAAVVNAGFFDERWQYQAGEQ